LVKAKHIPQRTCVGCRSTSSKREFVRVVRTPEGAVELDATAKSPGRGAYICAKPDCWTEALKWDRLAPALRTTISQSDREALERYGEQLAPAGAAIGS
jgi:predicted RNA-binding protein YlxR (DUF448 family)